jgi:hypothetical protein
VLLAWLVVLLAVIIIFAFGMTIQSATAKSVDAVLTVEVRIVPKQSDPGDLYLCFSKPPCTKLEKVGPDLYHLPAHLSRQYGDHPFVEYADDWDHLYLKLDQGYATIQSIYIRFDVSYDIAFYFNPELSYEFVNWQASGGKTSYRFVASNFYLDLSGDIEFNRRKEVARALGETDLSPANVNAIFNALPKIVNSAAHDIGQAGLVKYRGAEHDIQNGCDEFYCWHYVASITNDAYEVLDHCNCDNYNCNACCPFNCDPNQQADCAETCCFKYDQNAVPPRYICFNGTNPTKGWKQNDRLSKVVFNLDSSGKRVGIRWIYHVFPYAGGNDYDNWMLYAIEYEPKVGDMLFRHDNCPDYIPGLKNSSHAMMLLSGIGDDGTHITAQVIEKDVLVRARERDVARYNDTCNNPDGSQYLDANGNPVFRWDFYIGEVR